ncbi:hypothetical protein HAPAU_12910 [Halalkalicoccus paucihalophilus]|uniref:Uncharacterized protein n=2 Tax=Halalkalicoccus paucihalophilus TaxID=1008153 RepID=A0A151AET8_9EURY|nr:hypothetical protein HAPAU_12910 [Halalkalicoccus paucihalophilus]
MKRSVIFLCTIVTVLAAYGWLLTGASVHVLPAIAGIAMALSVAGVEHTYRGMLSQKLTGAGIIVLMLVLFTVFDNGDSIFFAFVTAAVLSVSVGVLYLLD